MSLEIEKLVKSFIAQNLVFNAEALQIETSTSLIDAGIIDSTAVLELVSFIESEFGIVVADAEIVPENLDSVGAITRFVLGKTTVAVA